MPPVQLEPDATLEIRDSLAAELYIEKLGLLGVFPQNPGGDSWMAVAVDLDHPTHALVGTHFTGFPDRKDNGYSLMCFPKSKFSPYDVGIYLNLLQQNG